MPPTLAQCLSDLASSDARQRLSAAEHLAQQPDAREAAVQLARATADENEEVREAVTGVLEDLGPPPAGFTPELASMLQDSNSDVAYWAATLLGRLGKDAAKAVPALTAALGPAAPLVVRQRSAWALGHMGTEAASARPALEMAAAHSDPRLARLAREALASIQGP